MSGPTSPANEQPTPEELETKRLQAQKLRYETRDARWKAPVTIVSLIAGVLAITTTGLTVLAANRSNEVTTANASNQALSSVVDANSSELTAAQVAIASQASAMTTADLAASSLSQENAALRSSLAALAQTNSTSAPMSPTVAARRAPGSVRHQGKVTMVSGGDAIDFNAPADDPTWGQGSSGSAGNIVVADDATYLIGGFLEIGAPSVPVAEGENPSYQLCKAKSGYGGGRIYLDALSDVAKTCIKLHSGRYATLSTGGGADDRLVLEVTVWEGA